MADAGLPMLIVDGRDPYAVREAHPSESYRLYRGEVVTAQSSPTVGQLRSALDAAAQ